MSKKGVKFGNTGDYNECKKYLNKIEEDRNAFKSYSIGKELQYRNYKGKEYIISRPIDVETSNIISFKKSLILKALFIEVTGDVYTVKDTATLKRGNEEITVTIKDVATMLNLQDNIPLVELFLEITAANETKRSKARTRLSEKYGLI